MPTLPIGVQKAYELVHAIRIGDLETVEKLSQDPETDINASVEVRGVRISIYRSNALFEACRSGSLDAVRLVLARPDVDVNAEAAAVHVTCLGDACNRGSEGVVALLLADDRVDWTKGSDDVRLPLEYACLRGHTRIVDLFLASGPDKVPLEHEGVLIAAASGAGHTELAAKLHQHFVSLRTLDDLDPRAKVEKIWHEFCIADADRSGSLDIAELRPLAARLGTPLSEAELAEAAAALDTDGDGTIDFEELIAFWLAQEGGIDPEVAAASAEISAIAKRNQAQPIPDRIQTSAPLANPPQAIAAIVRAPASPVKEEPSGIGAPVDYV